MPLLTIIILALIQGITEFLPVSSSGHLVLAGNYLTGQEGTEAWNTHMGINVAVHIGTLFSVLVYFRKDVITMLTGVKSMATLDFQAKGAKLNLYIIIGSVPVVVMGFILHILEPSWLLLTEIVAWTTLIFGILLWVADRTKTNHKTIDDLNFKDITVIGLAQMLALIPGTSRSGITMTAARGLGYSRTESAHISLLLAIIAIAGAGTLGLVFLIREGDTQLGFDALIAGILAFISGLIAIAVMMKWLEKASFTIFAIYRIILGSALLAFFYWPF